MTTWLGDLLGITGVAGPQGNAGAAASLALRKTALDSHHVIAWELDEAAGTTTITNKGSGAAADLTLGNASPAPLLGAVGPTGNCAVFAQTPGSNPGNNCFYGQNGLAPPTDNVSFEAWEQPAHVTTGQSACSILSKTYTSGTAFIFELYGIPTTTAGAGSYGLVPAVQVKRSGTTTLVTTGSTAPASSVSERYLRSGIWYHLMATYTSTTLILYVNGEVFASVASGSAIDYAYNATGPWAIGNRQGNSATAFGGKISRVRISDIVRDQAYARQVYARGMALPAAA